jgi:hypothetical protein
MEWDAHQGAILSKDALSAPHRTVVDPERKQIEALNQALKQAIIKELQQSQTGIFEHVRWSFPGYQCICSHIPFPFYQRSLESWRTCFLRYGATSEMAKQIHATKSK